MSDRQQLAEHATGLAIAVCGLTAEASGLVGGMVIGAVAYDTYTNCADRGARRAMENALAELSKARADFNSGDVTSAIALIKSSQHTLRINPAKLAARIASEDAVDIVLDASFGSLANEDRGTVAALRAAVGAALVYVRDKSKFNLRFSQDVLIRLLREQAQQTATLTDIQAALARIEGKIEADPELHRLREERSFVLALVEQYAPGQGGRWDDALANIEAALQLAAQDLALPRATNLGEAINDILARVDALNRDGKIEQAAKTLQLELDREAAEHELRIARRTALLRKAITQAVYDDSATDYARYQHELIQLDAPNAEDQFHRLRAIFLERYDEGFRKGTPFALTAAIGLASRCADIAPTPSLRAMAKNDHAVGLRNRGTRTFGPEGAALLAEAVKAFGAALEVFTRSDHPVEWARTQNKKAIALQYLGTRTSGPEGASYLARAVAAFDASLEVRTRTEHPVEWAMTHNSKAIALEEQGIRTTATDGASLLARAVVAYDTALEVRTRLDHPVDWAMTQNNKAGALYRQGILTAGCAGVSLLAQAVAAYDKALEVFTRVDHPVQWGETKANMAILFEDWAEREDVDDPKAKLRAALNYVDEALSVFNADSMSFHVENETKRREGILTALAKL